MRQQEQPTKNKKPHNKILNNQGEKRKNKGESRNNLQDSRNKKTENKNAQGKRKKVGTTSQQW